MLTITCHNDNIPERTYSINILFHTLLGLGENEYQIVFTDDVESYLIEHDKESIIVEDHFFIHYTAPLSYLKKDNIPAEVGCLHALGQEIPMIYGEDRFIQDDRTTIIGLDLFASIFFMLSRWEEYALGREDSMLDLESGSYYQTDEDELFCVRNQLTDKAFVHEYEHLLRELFNRSGIPIEQKRRFSVLLTHDVDKLSRESRHDIVNHFFQHIRRHQYKKSFKWLKKNLQILFFAFNRYQLFSKYLEVSSRHHLTDYFMFKTCEQGEEECTYEISSKTAKRIIHKLSKTSAKIGFHPSQNTFNNDEQFEKEYTRLVDACNVKPMIGRNHRLVHNSNTILQWEGISSPVISNYGYQRRIGFRCGVICPFPIFKIFSREQSKVKELPFVIMETSVKRRFKNLDQAWPTITHIIDQGEKYHGIICLNWHVRAFTRKDFTERLRLYSKILNYISDKGGTNAIVDDL